MGLGVTPGRAGWAPALSEGRAVTGNSPLNVGPASLGPVFGRRGNAVLVGRGVGPFTAPRLGTGDWPRARAMGEGAAGRTRPYTHFIAVPFRTEQKILQRA
jgi:hypothetical protein